jgi:hypothetical protein
MTRTLAAFLLLSLLSGGIIMTTSDSAIVVSADTPEQRSLAAWALERYERAGLALPSLTIDFAGRDQAACDGSPARTYFDETPMVKMCWNDRFMLLHELGHVWVAQNVPPAEHDAFMQMRDDVSVWTGTAVPWSERGFEHAANVIAWGLLEKPYPISRTYPNDKESLLTAFEFLTGREPLHNGGPAMQTPNLTSFANRSNPPLESGR